MQHNFYLLICCNKEHKSCLCVVMTVFWLPCLLRLVLSPQLVHSVKYYHIYYMLVLLGGRIIKLMLPNIL